eukprot:995802-Pleurochrysis_carterae.AAC.4
MYYLSAATVSADYAAYIFEYYLVLPILRPRGRHTFVNILFRRARGHSRTGHRTEPAQHCPSASFPTVRKRPTRSLSFVVNTSCKNGRPTHRISATVMSEAVPKAVGRLWLTLSAFSSCCQTTLAINWISSPGGCRIDGGNLGVA